MTDKPDTKIVKSNAEWQAELTPAQYAVCRCSATEPPFTGEYWNAKTKGRYVCAACGAALFSSEAKYDSGSGWPSYSAPIAAEAVETHEDHSHGMNRVEVTCHRCASHLGHVFPDGPPPSGLRYCINSAALKLIPDPE